MFDRDFLFIFSHKMLMNFSLLVNASKNAPKTQFHIKGGGLVQGVTKLIMNCSTFVTKKQL